MKQPEAFLSPLDGGRYHRGIYPPDIRYVLYLDPDFLRANKMTPSEADMGIANALFLGIQSNLPPASGLYSRPPALPVLEIGQAEYFILGHRVWDPQINAHLLKKLSWASIAGANVEQTVPDYITEMERNLDWIGSFNFVWRKGGLNVLREPLTGGNFDRWAQVWKFSQKGKIYDR